MKKSSSFMSKKFFIWGLIIMLVGYISYKHRLEIAVFLSCRNAYAPTWALDYVTVDENNASIEVVFKYKSFNKARSHSIKNAYDSIKEYFFIKQRRKYNGNILAIVYSNFSEGFIINGINTNSDKVQVISRMMDFSLKDIYEHFPNATSLNLSAVHYDDVREFDNFYCLEYVYFRQTVPEEDCEYIRKKFPNCVVEKWSLVNP
jgi:hypothetical protein